MPGINDPDRRYAGFTTLARGMDASKSPSLIGGDQCFDARNVTLRNGYPRSRPGFAGMTLNFPDEEQRAYFTTQLFQGAAYYQGAYADELLAMVGGKLFRLRVRPGTRIADVTDITPEGGRNSRRRPFAYFQQADKWMIIQDGQRAPILYDGGLARRSDPRKEVPVGTVMAYGYGRLFVAIAGRKLVAGDVIGSSEDAVIKFTENQYIAEGGSFSLPAHMGNIRAMLFLPVQDTATGQGELLVLAEFGVASFYVSVPRAQWKETQIQRVALLNTGALAHRGVTVINGDCWFRARDGWRSYRQARAEIGGWSRTAMSNEIGRYIETDTPALAQYLSCIYFDNRLLFTFGPQRFNTRARCTGIGSLDFQILTSFGGASAPAWEGVWTGIQPTQLVTASIEGVERAFAFAWDYTNGNRLIEITRNAPTDDGTPIASSLTLRSFDFEVPYTIKKLFGGDLWMADLRGEASVIVDYRADQGGCWHPWHTYSTCQTVATCTNGDGNCTLQNLLPGTRPAITLPAPPLPTSGAGRSPDTAFEFQPRLRWSGDFRWHKARFHARLLPETGRGATC